MSTSASSTRLQLLGSAPLLPLIMRLALPSIMGVSVSALSQLLNTFFIAELGTAALAALSISFPLVILLTSIGLCFGSGAASLIARSLGAGQRQDANHTAALSFRCAIAVAIVCALLGIIFANSLLSMFDVSDETLTLAVRYLRWMLVCHIILVGNMVCGFIVRSEGNTKLSMKTQLVAFSFNALFDFIFIFLLGLGIHGAGLATLLSQMLAILLYVHYFFTKQSEINPFNLQVRYSLSKLLAIIKIGFPAALNIIIAVTALAVLNKLASEYGDVVVAGIGIASRLILIAVLPINGLCIGSQSIIGYNIGAKNWSRVSLALKNLIVISLVFTSVYSLLIFCYANTITSLFSNDSDVIIYGAIALKYFHLSLPLVAIQAVFLMFLQAKGDSVKATAMAMLRQGIFLIPFLYVFHSLYGQDGLLYAFLFSDVLAGLIATILLLKQLLVIKNSY